MSFDALGPGAIALIAAVFLLAGFMHGALGFGFPLLATPVVALLVGIKVSILLVAPATLVVCVLSVVRGGGAARTIRDFWFLPLAIVAGAVAGTRLLIIAPPEPFVLLLAVMLVVYLLLDRLRKGAHPVVRRHRIAIGIGAGVLGGLSESMVNVALPPLIIYLMLLGLSPVATVQTLNLCFSVGKSAQVGTWIVFGGVPLPLWLTAAGLAPVGVIALLGGMRLRERIDAATYRRWLRGSLWAMAALLAAQFVVGMAR